MFIISLEPRSRSRHAPTPFRRDETTCRQWVWEESSKSCGMREASEEPAGGEEIIGAVTSASSQSERRRRGAHTINQRSRLSNNQRLTPCFAHRTRFSDTQGDGRRGRIRRRGLKRRRKNKKTAEMLDQRMYCKKIDHKLAWGSVAFFPSGHLRYCNQNGKQPKKQFL